MPLKDLIVIRLHYLFKGQAFQLGQILNLSLWPHLLWNKKKRNIRFISHKSQFKTFIPWLIQQNTTFLRLSQTKNVRLLLKRNMSVKPTPLDQPHFILFVNNFILIVSSLFVNNLTQFASK